MGLTFFILSWSGGLLTLGLIARLLAALFSEKSRQEITKHPKWHLIWIFIVIVLWIYLIERPAFERQKRIGDQLIKIRQNVQTSVNLAGGWNVLRVETKALSNKTNIENSFYWRFEKNAGLTNFFPLISKLDPFRIRFQKNTTNDGYAFVQIYFTQWGGGRGCTRYYDLVLTPTNHDELPSSFIRVGDKPLKLTNSVYEVTWHF